MFRVVLAVIATLGFVQQAAPTGTAVVTGQVIDSATKRPVEGVVVQLSPPRATAVLNGPPVPAPPPSSIKRALTNNDGRFIFRDLPAGTYALNASRAGYSSSGIGQKRPSGPQRNLTIGDGARVTDATIQIFRMPSITGTVRDDRGEPAVGVYVTAMRRLMAGGRAELQFSSGDATDDRGHYRVSFLEPGSYAVMVRSNVQTAPVSTVERYRTAVASGTAQQIARELREGGALQMQTEGIVIDGWQVGTRNEGPMMPGPNGTLFVSPMTFYGGTGSAANATVLTLAPGDDREGIDLTLPFVAGVRVSGTVTGLDRSASNYGVQLVPAQSGNLAYPFPVAYSLTDASGRFAFLGVVPGNYTARVARVPPTGPLFVPTAPGAAGGATREVVTTPPADTFPAMFAEAAVTVGSAHVDGVALNFQPGATLAGRVVFDGASAPITPAQFQGTNIQVYSISADSRTPSTTVKPDASGAFKTGGFAPGRYLIGAGTGSQWYLASVRAGGVDASVEAITLGTTDLTDVVVTFTDKPTMLSGTVRAADSSKEAESTVVAFPVDLKAWMASGRSIRRFATATTSASGAYQLSLRAPGEYLLVAIPPEIELEMEPDILARFAASATRVTIAAGETKTQTLTVSRVR